MGRAIMFLLFAFGAVVLAANIMQGHTDLVRTHLTQALDDDDTTIQVSRTTGFPNTGILVIISPQGTERVAYSSKTSTTFQGNAARPLIRGAEGTTAIAHGINDGVTTKEGGMLNDAADYNITVITDSSGPMAFLSKPLAFFALLGSFFILPLTFLGTDLQILTFLWAVLAIGITAAIMIQLAGGRRI